MGQRFLYTDIFKNIPGGDHHVFDFEQKGVIDPSIATRVSERFMAILIEHTAGEWPFWLNPRQLLVIPISLKCSDYANQVTKELFDAGFHVEVDLSDKQLKKKMMNVRLDGFFNYVLVVGGKEEENHTVNIRTRNNDVLGEMKVEDLITILSNAAKNFIEPTFPEANKAD